MIVTVNTRSNAVNYCNGKDPFHQNAPDGQEDNDGSSQDNEDSDENDSVIIEAEYILQFSSIPKYNLSLDAGPYMEHHLKITAPPPRS